MALLLCGVEFLKRWVLSSLSGGAWGLLIRDAAIDDAFVQRGGMSACDNNEGCQQEKSQRECSHDVWA